MSRRHGPEGTRGLLERIEDALYPGAGAPLRGTPFEEYLVQ